MADPVAILDPSDYYDQLKAGLAAALVDGLYIGGYAEWDGTFTNSEEIQDAAVLIEFERTEEAAHSPDGRTGTRLIVTAHCVVSRSRPKAFLDAFNLGTSLERVVRSNIWGIDHNQIERPERVHGASSMFKPDADGFEAWGITWEQVIYLGPSELEEDPVVTGVWFTSDTTSAEEAFERVENPDA